MWKTKWETWWSSCGWNCHCCRYQMDPNGISQLNLFTFGDEIYWLKWTQKRTHLTYCSSFTRISWVCCEQLHQLRLQNGGTCTWNFGLGFMSNSQLQVDPAICPKMRPPKGPTDSWRHVDVWNATNAINPYKSSIKPIHFIVSPCEISGLYWFACLSTVQRQVFGFMLIPSLWNQRKIFLETPHA